MWFYYLLLVFSIAGIAAIFEKKRGRKFFLRRFKKNFPPAIETKIPIEDSGGGAEHCPAVTLADESNKPNLNRTEKREIKSMIEKSASLMEKGDFNSAEKGFVKVLSLDENNLEANLNLGLIYLKKGLAAKAEAIYEKLIELKCADAVVYSNLGNAYYQQEKFTDSCDAYAKAVELDPQNPRRFINLGRVCHEMKNFDSAIEHIGKAVALDNNPEYHAMLADVYISLGNLARAKEIVEQGFLIDKKNLTLKAVAKKMKRRMK